jgi:hypothetical protein
MISTMRAVFCSLLVFATVTLPIRADVARIGAQTYPTLHAAVAASQSNDTIELIGDVILTNMLSISRPLAIVSDGSVRTITRTNAFADDLIVVASPGSLVLGNPGGNDEAPTLILDGGFSNGVAGGFSFLFATEANVTIHPGVILRHFRGFYAAIYMLDDHGVATLTLNGGLFTGNMSTNSSGGSIASQGADIYARNAIFTSNAAPRGRGGAIYLENATLAATNLIVQGNSADDYGGGLMIYPGVIQLTDGFIKHNSAINGGGIANGYGDVAIDGTTFTSNQAYYGAALWSHTGMNTLLSASLRGNQTTGFGGALYSVSSGLILSNCQLTANTAGSYGGALYVSPTVSPPSSIEIVNSSVVSNFGLMGGAIYSSHAFLDIDGTTFEDNRASGPGGALWLYGHTDIRHSVFIGNVSSNEGGGIFHLGGPLALSGQTFITGNAATQGNGVWCHNGPYEGGSNAVLTLSGGVSIATNNDLYLATRTNTVRIGGTLTAPGTVATVTPPAYSNGLPLLRDAAGLPFPAVSRYYGKFAISPQPASPTNWFMGTNGNLTATPPPLAPVPPPELRDIHSLAADTGDPDRFLLAVDPLLLEYAFTLQAADAVVDGGWNFQTLTEGYTVSENGVLDIDSDVPLRIYRLAF